jgi:hypothetical protein
VNNKKTDKDSSTLKQTNLTNVFKSQIRVVDLLKQGTAPASRDKDKNAGLNQRLDSK